MPYWGVWAWFPGSRELVKLPSTAFQPPLFLGQSALRQRAHLFSLLGTSLPIISYFYPNAFHLCPTWMAHFLPGFLFISVMKIVLRSCSLNPFRHGWENKTLLPSMSRESQRPFHMGIRVPPKDQPPHISDTVSKHHRRIHLSWVGWNEEILYSWPWLQT